MLAMYAKVRALNTTNVTMKSSSSFKVFVAANRKGEFSEGDYIQ